MIHQLKDEQYEKLKEVLDMVLVNYKINIYRCVSTYNNNICF